MSKAVKSQLIFEAIAAAFILLFLYSAITKTIEIRSTSNVLRKISMLSDYATILSWTVVFIEYGLVLLLFFPRTKRLGMICTLITMSLFTIYIGLMMIFIPDLPCSCGGVISLLTWKQHLLFNSIFIVLASIAVRLSSPNRNKLNQDFRKEKIAFN